MSEADPIDTYGALSLDELSQHINALHKECEQRLDAVETAARQVLKTAWHAGAMLTLARDRIRSAHPDLRWTEWLAQNFQGNERTARRYMLLYRKTTGIEDMPAASLRQCYLKLGILKPPTTPTKPTSDFECDEIASPGMILNRFTRWRTQLRGRGTKLSDAELKRLQGVFRELYEFLRDEVYGNANGQQ